MSWGVSSAPPADTASLLPISDREYGQFQKLIRERSGIHLSAAKRALLVARLSRRLMELNLSSFSQYYKLVCSEAAELTEMLERICTHETHFFREPQQFDVLTGSILPAWHQAGERGLRPRRIRVWSAGCSTGEEPYSVAMVLLDRFPAGAGWTVEILASDLSRRAVHASARGVWPIHKASEIPKHYLRRFMLRGTRADEGWMTAGPELRSVITVTRINLNEPDFAAGLGRFDLIFCRNVLIYFHLEGKRRVTDTLLHGLNPDGCLFLGHSESASSIGVMARAVGPSIFAPRPMVA